ncbi:hypothetical protein BDN67DRAFT_1008347 [Paxillus ammoniavirescens]|nr:hypothetical protein BDN67DRAFT_1008347 [Paxillus ammoniavirescens]
MSDPGANVPADYGPLLLGGLLAFSLSGCVSMQFSVYWQIFPEEAWPTKLLVVTTWVLDLCHSAFVAVAIWDSLIVSYGDLGKIDVIPWSVGVSALPPVATIIDEAFAAYSGDNMQSFFAYRIYRLHKHKFTVAGPVAILAFIRLVAASVSLAEMIRLKHYSAFVRPFPSWVFTSGLFLSAVVDIVITTSLCYLLRSNRSSIASLLTRVSVSSTNHIIDVLTLWTVRNGSVTCLAAIASLICWKAMPNNRIFLGLHFVVGKLYANSLFATLNARKSIRKPQKYTPQSNIPPIVFPDNFGSEGDASPHSHREHSMRLDALNLRPGNLKSGQSIQVNVQQTVEAKYDGEGDIDPLSSFNAV